MILRSRFGALPDDFTETFDLLSLLWEEAVGKRVRESEREEQRKAAAQFAQYQASVEHLKRRQQE